MKAFAAFALILVALVVCFPNSSYASIFYTDFSAWETAAGGAGNVTFYKITQDNGTTLNSLVSPFNPADHLNFDNTLTVAEVPNGGWATWNSTSLINPTPKVLISGLPTLTGTFDPWDFGFEIEPNAFDTFEIGLEAFDHDGNSLGTLTQPVNGSGGAQFFGWSGADVKSFTITAPKGAEGFAFGNIVMTDRMSAVPEPATMSLLGFGLLGLFGLKRKQKI